MNAIIRPCAIDGPSLSIRKFSKTPMRMAELLEHGALTKPAALFLEAAVKGRLNVLISGGTGSGKTTMLNAMSAHIDPRHRMVTIEDAAELQLQQEHVVRLETRPANAEGSGRITQRDLLVNALRMRPDRIMVGEVRGAEAFDMLQAMNTGHDGSMTTIHANTARDAVSRLEQMVTMIGSDFPLAAVRSQIAAGLQLVVQLNRLSDGRRRVMSISEVVGLEGNTVMMQDIFTFKKMGVDSGRRGEGPDAGDGHPPALLRGADVLGRGPAARCLRARRRGARVMALSPDAIWLVFALGATLIAALGLRLVLAPENAQDRKALARVRGLSATSGHTAVEAIVRAGSRRVAPGRFALLNRTLLLIRHAGFEGRETLVALCTAALAVALTLPLMMQFAAPMAFALACGGAVQITRLWLRARHRKQTEAITRQLPDALDLMMRGLRVGHPVNATIQNVARTMADPIGAEFRQLSEQIAHGDYLADAFTDMADRLGQEDIDYLAVSIRIQHGTGGNLAEMLGTLSTVVRNRIVMRRRIRAISSEGRISAYLLSALPVVIYLATSISAPDYYGGVSDDPAFRPIAFTIVGLVIANFLALRRLVTFDL